MEGSCETVELSWALCAWNFNFPSPNSLPLSHTQGIKFLQFVKSFVAGYHIRQLSLSNYLGHYHGPCGYFSSPSSSPDSFMQPHSEHCWNLFSIKDIFIFIWKADFTGRTERDWEIPFTGLLPRWSQWLSQATRRELYWKWTSIHMGCWCWQVKD